MIVLASLSLVIVLICLFMNYRLRRMFDGIIEYQVKENAIALADLFSEKLNAEFSELKSIVSIVERDGNSALVKELLQLHNSGDVELGIFNIYDSMYLSPEILNSFRGWDSVGYDAFSGLTFSVPVYSQLKADGQHKADAQHKADGQLIADRQHDSASFVDRVLYRKYSASKLNDIFSLSCYGDNGIACVIKSDGEMVIPFKNGANPLIAVYNSETIRGALVSIRNKMVSSSSAVVHFRHAGIGYYLFEAVVIDSDFRILGLIKENAVYKGFGALQGVLLWVFGMLALFIIIGTSIVMDTEEKSLRATSEKKAALAESQAKGSFLASMSHEIRTPLNAIVGMNDIVLRETTEANIKEYAGQIRKSSETLLSLINDVLDFSRIESGRMKIHNAPYHLHAIINDVSVMVSEKVRQKNLSFKTEIDYELPDELLGDEIRIKQILINILNNAVKYTERGSVHLRVFGERECDELFLHIVVRDTGIGIEKDSIPFLFNSFSRADEERNKYIEGTGLGLAIVKQLVDMMDGHINVRSVYGVGSEFEVVIPQKVIGTKNIQESAILNDEPPDKDLNFIAPDAHVVVVDDNEVNLLVAEKLLATMKIHVHSFKDPAVALGFLKVQNVDILFLDDIMPGMNGVELLGQVKEPDSVNAHTASVALTANALAGSREKYMSAGFDSYLSKPVSLNALKHVVHALLPEHLVQVSLASEPVMLSASEQKTERLIDEKTGISYCAGSMDIYRTIIEKFIDVSSAKKQLMQDALSVKNWKDLLVEVHALKSSAMSIGAKKLSDDAKAMELVLKELVNALNVETNVHFVENNIETLFSLYDTVVCEAKKI